MSVKKEDGQGYQLSDPILLKKIDKLFEHGVGDHIDLPQLVVVGDQSSGKSSVLEGLTKLPFPRDSTLCTRFATQITFRRAAKAQVTITIIPEGGSDAAYQQKLRDWSKTETETLNSGRFTEIMKEVHEVMNIGAPGDVPGKRGFSEDVLRIEVSGPEQEHFSVVDVPGIFRKVTPGVTTKADIDTVRAIVKGYMRNPRSVLLAVVPANVDVATQDILTMAEEYDKEGIRTIGILTKPDLVDHGAEGPVLDLLAGRSHQLNLGWCVVKNASQKELLDPSVDRDSSERNFFSSTPPWNSLEANCAGISNLRMRLHDVLSTHIRREFPKVKAEIQRRLRVAEVQLKGLGGQRETSEEQRGYLINLANEFQTLISAALNADYTFSACFDDASSILRLPTQFVQRNDAFTDDMARYGHSHSLSDRNLSDDHQLQLEEFELNAEQEHDLQVRKFTDAAFVNDIEDVIIDTHAKIEKHVSSLALRWLQRTYENSRGFELGTYNKSLLATAIRDQSSKWDLLALGYISDIIHMVHTFINSLLEIVCNDSDIRERLCGRFRDDLLARYQQAFDHVKFLLHTERNGVPMTQNQAFMSQLEKSAQASDQDSSAPSQSQGNKRVKRLDVRIPDTNSKEKFADARQIGNILRAYYDIARDRFVDNVCKQSAMHHLISGASDTPLSLFTSSWVAKLSLEDLEEIAGDDVVTKQKRSQLKRLIAYLEEGKKILR